MRLALLVTLLLLVFACQSAEEEAVAPSGTLAASSSPTVSATEALSSPTATQTPDGTAPATGCSDIWPDMSLSLEGPGEVARGQVARYLLRYDLKEPGAVAVRFDLTGPSSERLTNDDLPLTSSKRLSGDADEVANVIGEPAQAIVLWYVSPGAGSLELDFQIPADFPHDIFYLLARVGGTCTARSNLVVSAVSTE